MELIGLLALSILLGLRHGIDLDHVAALADITGGSSGSKKERMKLSLWYAGGHEAVVFVFGCSILLFAWTVPIWAEHWMGKAGMLAVATFSIGLLLSHALIAIVSLWFHDLAKKTRPLLPITMYAACLFSFVLGVSYLLEYVRPFLTTLLLIGCLSSFSIYAIERISSRRQLSLSME